MGKNKMGAWGEKGRKEKQWGWSYTCLLYDSYFLSQQLQGQNLSTTAAFLQALFRITVLLSQLISFRDIFFYSDRFVNLSVNRTILFILQRIFPYSFAR